MPTIELRNGDCLELLKTVPAQSVDTVITSPPYNKNETAHWTGGAWKASSLQKGYGEYKDALPWADYVSWQKAVLTECWRVLKPTGAIFYNHKPRPKNKQLETPLELNPGLPLRQIIIWDTNSRVNFSEHHFVPAHEWICVFAGPEFKLRSRSASKLSDVWRMTPNKDPLHPAPFPLDLPRRILNAVFPGGSVLDPFMGSGTTGIAAVEADCDFIGFELSAEYYSIARTRIDKAMAASTSLLKAA